MFSANQKPFVVCTRVTEELHSFLSQSELSNFFVYIITLKKIYSLSLPTESVENISLRGFYSDFNMFHGGIFINREGPAQEK